jgi:pimeloyl-ACP methyl ester carboxylesterase
MSDPYDPRLSVVGSGRPVVLVPGLDGTGLLFYRQLPRLARTFRVASYALRDEATTMEVLVADLRDIVRAVAADEGRAIVVGESFGGALAMSLALAEPELVSELVILNSFPRIKTPLHLRVAIGALHLIPWGAMSVVRRATAWRLHSRHTHKEELDRFMQLTARASRQGYVNRLTILSKYDIRERLTSIAARTLFLAAEEDHLVPSVREARYMAARVPGAVMRVLAGHGHICLIAPDLDLDEILREWLAI